MRKTNRNCVSAHNHSLSSKRQYGQGMTEYIIIVAIIAIGAVTASGFFGGRLQAQFVSMGNEISGEQGTPNGGVTAPTAAPATLGSYVNN